MIITLHGSDRKDKPDIFEQLFRLRHDIFVKGRGWSLPCGNGRETDQYDVDEAVYFIDLNSDGVIESSVRATPTEKYSLLADYFPYLIENGMPARAPDVYECTRYIVMPAQKSRENNRAAKARLLIALFQWAIVAEALLSANSHRRRYLVELRGDVAEDDPARLGASVRRRPRRPGRRRVFGDSMAGLSRGHRRRARIRRLACHARRQLRPDVVRASSPQIQIM